jgi:hypothetical protein
MISLPEHHPCGIPVCHDTTVMSYAAYLRIYEPVAAFHEPDRSRWAVYAASSARAGRRDSLAAEQAEALHRAIAAPHIGVPDQESEHTAGGARSPNTRWRTEYPAGPADTFRASFLNLWRDTTISIARLTESDSDRRSNRASRYRNLRVVVDASRLVMAIWSLSAI